MTFKEFCGSCEMFNSFSKHVFKSTATSYRPSIMFGSHDQNSCLHKAVTKQVYC